MGTVKWSPISAIKNNQAPGSIIIGQPGSGKTFFLQNIAGNALGLGQQVIVIDPKTDFKALYNINPEIEFIDINNIRPGSLNPFLFLSEKDQNGMEIGFDVLKLKAIIELMCGKSYEQDIARIQPLLSDIIKDAYSPQNMDGENTNYDLQKMIIMLKKSRDMKAMDIANVLESYKESKYGKLLFNDKKVEPLKVDLNRSIVISIFGLAMPDASKEYEDYTEEERLTSCILYIITNKLKAILVRENKIPVVFICDEARILFSNAAMSAIIVDYLSLGRSRNVATILASQGLSHFPKDIDTYLTSKFMFKSSKDDAKMFLDKFDGSQIDPSLAINRDSVIFQVGKFERSGLCFFIDNRGRNGFIRIIPTYDPKLLTSNPFEKKDS